MNRKTSIDNITVSYTDEQIGLGTKLNIPDNYDSQFVQFKDNRVIFNDDNEVEMILNIKFDDDIDIDSILYQNTIDVSSSNISSFWYDPFTEILRVGFLSGSLYEYTNVPVDVYHILIEASSHGEEFWESIRRQPYSYQQLSSQQMKLAKDVIELIEEVINKNLHHG